jgi:hypothetical protein
MKLAILIPVLLAPLLLAACDREDEHKNAPKLFEEQRNMLDKAKNVEHTLQQQADEQNKAIDRQSQ